MAISVATSISPTNFSCVINGVYRSAFPKQENFEFLSNLNLKTILYLCPEDYPVENKEFISKNNITLLHFGMVGNKFPDRRMSNDLVLKALNVLLNPQNYPILIHCNKGKHRTGCIVGCLRKIQKWNLSDILKEYKECAGIKYREIDLTFIENFDVSKIILPSDYKLKKLNKTPIEQNEAEGIKILDNTNI